MLKDIFGKGEGERNKEYDMVQSLDRGIKILEILERRKSAGVTEIAAELGINKSSAFRLIDTLRKNNLVDQDPDTDKYRLSGGILRFGNAFLNNTRVVDLSQPYMEDLSRRIKENVHLCVFTNNRVVVISQVRSPAEMIEVNAAIGGKEPIYCSAVGKTILAFLPGEMKTEILSTIDFIAYTHKTITDRTALDKCLEKVREQGWAIDDEELTCGVRCIAAPIFNHSGRAQYSLGISALSTRIADSRTTWYAEQVKKTADVISRKLGYCA